jgi:putative spermidine/putrescine transport system substrate-binding protein
VEKAAPRELIVNCFGGAYQEFFEKEILPDFEKKHNVKVKLAVGLAKDWIAKMKTAGVDNPPYDVLMLNEIWASQLRREGFFVELPVDKVPNLKNVIVRNKNDNGVIGAIQPIGIAYRTDLVSTPPVSWKDLWKDEYKGKIGLYTITNSAAMMFFMSTATSFGGDQNQIDLAFEKIKALKPFKQTDFSGDMEKLLTLGEISLGVLDSPAAARLIKQGIPVKWVEPQEGLLMFEQDFNVTKGSKEKELAYAYINYMLSDEVQAKWVKKFYITPVTKNATVPEELKQAIPVTGEKIKKIWLWDWDAINDRKQEIVNRWNREISG